MIEIKNATGTILKSVDAKTLEDADLEGANLRGADLEGAQILPRWKLDRTTTK